MQHSPVMHTYGRLPVAFTRGLGAWLEDTEGRRYLDALGGIAVCALGHAHPGVTAAIQRQAASLLHTSNLYAVPLQQQLAAKLCALSGLDAVFFCNSGAEANEAAIKIARRHGHARGIERPTVVVMEQAFHGRTLATLTATGNIKAQQGFGPLLEGFVRVPFDDLAAIDALAGNPDIVAVLVEPIQGEGGIHVPSPAYLQGLRERCDRQGWLLMLDEVQSGMGRTGRWFAFQHAGILPDVLSLAKALGNGVPIGACVARGDAARLLQPGSHGSTFGGNPLAAAAALAVIEAIEADGLVERAARLGQRLRQGLLAGLGQEPGVVEVRGLGLMIGIELEEPCAELVARALDVGLLINVTAGRVIRLLPAYILSDAECDELCERLIAVVRAHLRARHAETLAATEVS
jgi:acetylornithine/N-succinyldiaminopimelate aminotransferase